MTGQLDLFADPPVTRVGASRPRKGEDRPPLWIHESHAEDVAGRLSRPCDRCDARPGQRCRPDVSYRNPEDAPLQGVWFAFHMGR